MPWIPFLFRLPNKLRRRVRRARMTTLTVLVVVVFLFAVPFYVIYKPPSLLIRYFSYRWPDVLWQVDLARGAEKLVALTIDDAPSRHTRDILAALAESGARATFFVIGAQVAEMGGDGEILLADAVRAGHELGNHAMRDEPSRALGDDELASQIADVQAVIERAYVAAGKTAPWMDGLSHDDAQPGLYFRPGSGFFSHRIRELVRKMGYKLVLGSIYPHDAQIKYWWINARHILSMLRPGGIIICHDRRSWTPPMLRKVLPKMKRRGYRVVTVTELLDAPKPG